MLIGSSLFIAELQLLHQITMGLKQSKTDMWQPFGGYLSD